MNFGQSFRLAIKSLLLSKVRAMLTMLGIIIGVAAVITILSLGDGLVSMMNESFESIGTNTLIVNIMGRGTSRSVEPEELYALAEENPELLEAVSPLVSARVTVKHGSETYDRTTVSGINEDYDTVASLKVKEGRFIQYIDILRLQNSCVVGSYLEQEMFKGEALGKTLKLNGNEYTVVGVLEEKVDSTENSDDNSIFIPYTNAAKLNHNATYTTYYCSTPTGGDSIQAKHLLENRLYRTFEDSDAYSVVSMAELVDTLNSMMSTMMLAIAAIAAISLLVGGIGIMNIMLVSVTERTREIGIRKSLGAKKRDIKAQFIIEAGTTSAIGGIVGIVVGIVLAGVAGSVLDLKATPTAFSILLSFGVSVAVGVVFGYLPANKAARLNPIDALRYE